MFVHIFLIFLYTEMSQGSADFFSNAKDNLTKVTWAHAINNGTLLDDALKSNVMMLEADVSYGKLSTDVTSKLMPIMAHPPANTSDLSLLQFLSEVSHHNEEDEQKKGVKLDFKSMQAFNASMAILKQMHTQMKYPVWLNADIIPGPVKASTTPLNATEFLQGSSQFPNFTLSVGWTTYYNEMLSKYSYTDSQINEMIKVLKDADVKQVLTFAVRAGLAAESKIVMKKLLDEFENATFTIWSSVGDPVDIQNLRTFIFDFGVNKMYLDVPEELSSKLHLESSSNCAGNIGLFSVLLSTIVMIITSKTL